MKNIIYTDYDVRPDLLTAEERAQYPDTLNNEDRRAILTTTRMRMDNVDYDGHPILSPEEWCKAMGRYTATWKEEDRSPGLRESITRDVVMPETGEVVQVDAGLSDIVQRLLDRGLVVDVAATRSGLVTDHPGMRWMHDDNNELSTLPYPSGTHIYADNRYERPAIVFPTDSTLKFYNNARTADAVREVAEQAGLLAVEHRRNGRNTGGIEVQLPYLMDGTGLSDFQTEAKAHAESRTTARPGEDMKGWIQQIEQSKKEVAEIHGGIALYSDNMILDRLARFERMMQRMMVSDRMLQERIQPEVNMADFLTTSQLDELEKEAGKRYRNIYNERALPYVYQVYRNNPDKVDEVARMAGYTNYIAYLNEDRKTSMDSGKRWSLFRKLEKEHLQTDHLGVLKLFRINNGIRKDVTRWKQEEVRKLTDPVIRNYREAGYPVDALKEFYIVHRSYKDADLDAIGVIRGRTQSRPVSKEDMVLLRNNAITPFDAALNAFADDLGWKGKLIMPVSSHTFDDLKIGTLTDSGPCPVCCKGEIYKVSDAVWSEAAARTRFESMPPNVRQAVLDIHPACTSVSHVPFGELAGRIQKIHQKIDAALTDVKVRKSAAGDEIGFLYKIGGASQSMQLFKVEDLKFSIRTLPGENRNMMMKDMLADRHMTAILSQDVKAGMRR